VAAMSRRKQRQVCSTDKECTELEKTEDEMKKWWTLL
jgi:hypothetical protein